MGFKSVATPTTLIALFVVFLVALIGCNEAKVLVNTVRFRRLPPQEFSAVQGSSVIIECEAVSSPPPTVRWLKNGKLIHQSESDNMLDDGTSVQQTTATSINLSATRSRLYLDCVDITDGAVYTCVAENIYSKISSTTKLNIIDLESTSEIVASGDSTGEQSASTSNDQAASPLIPVPQGSKSQAGPPRIHMWTHNIIEVSGNDVQLFCRSNKAPMGENKSQDGPQYSVSWVGPDDKPIRAEQALKYETLDTGDLIIHNLQWSDMGSYTCSVSDDRDNRDSATIFVYPTKSKKAERERTLNRRLEPNNVVT